MHLHPDVILRPRTAYVPLLVRLSVTVRELRLGWEDSLARVEGGERALKLEVESSTGRPRVHAPACAKPSPFPPPLQLAGLCNPLSCSVHLPCSAGKPPRALQKQANISCVKKESHGRDKLQCREQSDFKSTKLAPIRTREKIGHFVPRAHLPLVIATTTRWVHIGQC